MTQSNFYLLNAVKSTLIYLAKSCNREFKKNSSLHYLSKKIVIFSLVLTLKLKQ